MGIAALLQTLGGRALAPFGELGYDMLLERSLDAALPEVKPGVAVTLRFATPADIDEICRMYEPDPFLYIGDPTPSPGRHERARELYAEIVHDARHWPRHAREHNREWLQRAQAALGK